MYSFRMRVLAGFFLIVGAAWAQSATVMRTGQRDCSDEQGSSIPCVGSGQDGDLQMGLTRQGRRFANNNDGTVTDRLTGLIWLRDADCFKGRTWSDSLINANTLAHGACGLTDRSIARDWRMPNINELTSLLDFGSAAPALTFGHPFINVSKGIYWTSTSAPAAPALAWFSTLTLGPTVFDVKINMFHLWPVKGGRGGEARLAKTNQKNCYDPFGATIPCAGTGQDGEIQAGADWPTPRFLDNGNGTVTDRLTRLVWLKNTNCLGFATWGQALEKVKDLYAGSCGLTDSSKPGDWRIPNVREAQSLQDYSTFAPDLPTGHPFLNVQPTLTWTSTTTTRTATQAWFTIYGVGPTVFEDKTVPLAVWPVRGGDKLRLE